MATGIPSAHPPYKMMIDGNLSDYITAEYRPVMVQDEQFVFRKPGEIKVAHLDAWLHLLQQRQDRFLRRELDDIFRFAAVKGGLIPKPALYGSQFMKSYALEHGPIYKPGIPATARTNIVLTSEIAATSIPNERRQQDEQQVQSESADNTNAFGVDAGAQEREGDSEGEHQASELSAEVTIVPAGLGELPPDDNDAQLVDQYLGFDDDLVSDSSDDHNTTRCDVDQQAGVLTIGEVNILFLRHYFE